jgi:hypothetical protein
VTVSINVRDANEIEVPVDEALVQVYATFEQPGEYVLAQVDNFDAPDSSGGNQCCWTNGYVAVAVAPSCSGSEVRRHS